MEPPEKGTRILMTASSPVKRDSELITEAIGAKQPMHYKWRLYTASFSLVGASIPANGRSSGSA
jgi:hypothetical protein